MLGTVDGETSQQHDADGMGGKSVSNAFGNFATAVPKRPEAVAPRTRLSVMDGNPSS